MKLKFVNKLKTSSERIIAVDVGTRVVRIVELSKRKDGIVPILFDALAIPFKSSRGDISSENVSETLNLLLKKNGIKHVSFFSLLPREFVTIKHFEVPTTQPDFLKKIMPFEAEKQLPFAIERSIIDFDFEVLNNATANNSTSPAETPEKSENSENDANAEAAPEATGGTSLVTLVAVRNAIIPKFLELVTLKNYKQKKIGVSSIAQLNLINYALRKKKITCPEGEDILLLEIGASRTEFALIMPEKSRMCFTRSVSLGGDIYTSYIAKEQNISFESAEKLKLNSFEKTGLVDPKIFDEVTTPLLLEIERTIQYIYKKNLSGKIGKIL